LKASFEFLDAERTMQENKSNSSIKVGETGWISIHIDGGPGIEPYGRTILDGRSATMQAEIAPLFAHAERARTPLPERYPRLTLVAIALFLLISALTAEFEYLRGAGYSWP
jgi:hypothetical protein